MGEGGLLGWSTNALVKLDDEVPGVLSRALTAAPARRQAIFAALAAWEVSAGVFDAGEDLFPMSFAEVLRHGRTTDILRNAFGDVPEGFSGLLARVGDRPLPRAKDYIALHALLASGNIRGVEALRGGDRITCRKLEVLASLDPRWQHANTVQRIDTGSEAATFNSAVNFVQSVNSRATDDAVAGAIALMRPTSTLSRLLDRFLRRADRLPPHPVPQGDDEIRPLLTVDQHVEAARRFRNCLASKIDQIAAGRLAIAEFRGEVLLEFRPLTANGGWLLWAFHGHRNEMVDDQITHAATAKCDQLRIHRPNNDVGGANWRSYRRYTRDVDRRWAT